MLVNRLSVSIQIIPMRGKDDIIFTFASGNNSKQLIRLFDSKLASANDVDPEGWSLLHWAASFGAWDTCGMLLTMGAKPDMENSSMMDARDLAIRWSLQEHGTITNDYYKAFGYANSPRLEELGFSRLHKALFEMLGTSLTQELSISTVAINQPDCKGATPLLWAARLRDASAVGLLVAAGAMPTTSDFAGTTPLHIASLLPFDTFCLLLANGADPNARDAYKETALHGCCKSLKDPRYAAKLITAGADVNAQDLNGWAPLHWLARYDRAETMELILSNCAIKDPRTFVGWTPMFFAVRYNSHKALKILISSGADVSVISEQNDSVLHYAAAFADEATLLILAIADLHLCDPKLQSFAWSIPTVPVRHQTVGKTPEDLFRQRQPPATDSTSKAFDELIQAVHSAHRVSDPNTRSGIDQPIIGTSSPVGRSEASLMRIPGAYDF